MSPVNASLLATIQLTPGLGEVKAKCLLSKFSTLKAIAGASEQDLTACVGKSSALAIGSFLMKQSPS
jgi:excinuclease UvrABC nuclease subunit